MARSSPIKNLTLNESTIQFLMIFDTITEKLLQDNACKKTNQKYL